MAIQLEANFSKKLGLRGYSSHQYSVTIRIELGDIKQVESKSSRLYALLQGCVDRDIQETGFLLVNGNCGQHNGSNGPATAKEAIQVANLDWKVSKIPVFTTVNGQRLLVPDTFAVVRNDPLNSPVLGVVSKDYTPLQNAEAFGFFDPIVGENAAIYHTAGALGQGERIWLLAKLPDNSAWSVTTRRAQWLGLPVHSAESAPPPSPGRYPAPGRSGVRTNPCQPMS